MRVDLKVPFAEKDEAKKLGARWDAVRKIWYVEDKVDMVAYSRWSPVPHESAGTAVAKQQSTGKVIVGSHYRECPRVCDCLPWDDCEKCRTGALPG